MRFGAQVGALALAASLGCSGVEPTRSASSSPRVQHVTVDSVGLAAYVDVTVPSAATVTVRYWPADAPGDTVSVRATIGAGTWPVTLTRVEAGETYRYSAFVADDAPAAGIAFEGTFTSPPLPSDLDALDVEPAGRPDDELMMMSPRTTSGFLGFVAVDARGKVVWYYRTNGVAQGIIRIANGDYVLNDQGSGLREVTPAGVVVRKLDYGTDGAMPHHDLVEAPNGHILFLSHDVRPAPGLGEVWGDGIFDWDPATGAVAERWSIWDWFDPAVDWGRASSASDWVHANSLAIGPHGNVLLSLNWLNEVVSIAPDWRSIEWRLGGRNGDFALDSAAQFSGQHSVTMPAEGRVLMFDNQRESTASVPTSRGLELALDTAAHRATVAWQFASPEQNFAPYLGLARRLPSGNTFVFFGLPDGPFGGLEARGPVSGYEVTNDGRVVFRTVVTGVKSVYRGWLLSRLGGEGP